MGKGVVRIDEINRFETVNVKGEIRILVEYQEHIDSSSARDLKATIPGRKFIKTIDNVDVNLLDNDSFMILDSMEVVKRK
ncbi:MAG: hypothetical protein JW908_04295 [Anaerolineales bacterium]|nr:hypothetical protein [Anaerolineales bacterium]